MGAAPTQPTVTDCALVLGLLDPDIFLGGRMRLDDAGGRPSPRRARRPAPRHIRRGGRARRARHPDAEHARRDRGDHRQAGHRPGAHRARRRRRRCRLQRGRPSAGGSSCRATLFPGDRRRAQRRRARIVSDLVFSDARIHYVRSDAADPAAVADILDELAASAGRFLAESASSARTAHRLLGRGALPAADLGDRGADRLADRGPASRHGRAGRGLPRRPQALYAVSDPASPVEFIAWRVRASTSLGQAAGCASAGRRAGRAEPRRRRIWLRTAGRRSPLHRFGGDPGRGAHRAARPSSSRRSPPSSSRRRAAPAACRRAPSR